MVFSKVLIFGGTGSLGTNIIKQWQNDVGKFIVYSRDEFKQWQLKQKFKDISFVIGDIADYSKVKSTILSEKPSLIIIASAMKHIDACQKYPKECFNTNVIGLLNVINSIEELKNHNISFLKKIVFVSTDKACEPITIYGMSKSISEHIVQTMHCSVPIVAVRYGNVINSNGSIIPIFQQQAKNQSFVTVTDVNMTRFYMTLDQSVQLIQDSVYYGGTKEIWIPKLDSMKIIDLAELFAEKYSLEIKIIGLRCREKIHEALISEQEFANVRESNIDGRVRLVITNEEQNKLNGSNYTSKENIIIKERLGQLLKDYI